MTRHLVTSALPYANGPIHFGHVIGAYLPADVYARTLRMQGLEVLFVCGTDEYGTAITVNAEQAGVPPTRISFIAAVRTIRTEWEWSSMTASPGAIPRHLAEMRDTSAAYILPPRRERSYPRAVKIKMSNYARKRPSPSGGPAK